MHLSRN